MAAYTPRLLGSATTVNSSRDPGSNFTPADGSYANNYFRSAQWSPDGTTILTSSADNALRNFILPTDLLTSPTPHILTPYTTHHIPEPAYATAFHPSYCLQEPASTLYLVSLRSLPICLYSPFAPSKVASYPLVSPTTEAFIAPHSLLFFPQDPSHFFAGSESCISVFDVQRDGEGPLSKMRTTTSRRGNAGIGMKGIVSALGMSSEGLLAAGTFTRNVGLYDDYGSGGTVAIFPLRDDDDRMSADGGLGQGTGVTQLLWSACSRYLCVVERGSDGIGIWDIRGTGRRLAWLRGRRALTPQRLGAEVAGHELWAGGTDGKIRVWDGLGTKEGVIDPVWESGAHDDAVCATTLHSSGSVLASASGQRHIPFANVDTSDDLYIEGGESPEKIYDHSLKLWAL